MSHILIVDPDPAELLKELENPVTSDRRKREIVFGIAFKNLQPFVLQCRILLEGQIAKAEREAKERSREIQVQQKPAPTAKPPVVVAPSPFPCSGRILG